MSRKIKSVKLRNDYRDRTHYILAGTKLTNNNSSYWWLADIIPIHEDEIREDKTGLYGVEYEHGRKSITVKIEYDDYDGNSMLTCDIIKSLLNLDLNLTITEVTND